MYSNCIKEVREILIWPDSTIWSGWQEYVRMALASTIIKNASFVALDILIVTQFSPRDFEFSLVIVAVLQVSYVINLYASGI